MATEDPKEGVLSNVPYMEIDFDDEGIQSTDADKYKGEKGRVDRIWIPTLSVTMAFVHFIEEGSVGYVLSDGKYEKDPKTGKYRCAEMGPIDKLVGEEGYPRFALNFAQYATKHNGEMGKPFSYAIKVGLWRSAHFIQIRSTNQAFKKMGGITEVDLMLNCEDSKFQRIQFQGIPECFIKSLSEKQRQEGIASEECIDAIIAEECLNAPWDARKLLGKNWTLAEVVHKMKATNIESVEAGAAGGQTVAEEDLDDVIASLKKGKGK